MARYTYNGAEYTSQGIREVKSASLAVDGLKKGQTFELLVNREDPEIIICKQSKVKPVVMLALLAIVLLAVIVGRVI